MPENTPLLDGGSGVSCFGTPTIRALWIATLTFAVFTTVELIYGFIADSLEMQIDAYSMAVDVTTYAINIYAEYTQRLKWRIVAVCWSALALTAITTYLVSDSAIKLSNMSIQDDNDVDAWVLLGFALGNLAVDIISLGYVIMRVTPSQWLTPLLGDMGAPVDKPADSGASLKQGATFGRLNLASAVVHVLVDTFRTATEIISSLVILNSTRVNSTQVDAIGTLIIAGITYLLIALMLYRLISGLAFDGESS
mmetsp:Transcript_71576/g.141924  ORF Transcript_71576/g.141924 Transcript_71576/m.141924 type:complete len:252 (-) Transcript_71576:171-926(-)